VGDGKKAKPVLNKLGSNLWIIVDVCLLVLDNLTKTSNSIVSSVMVLGNFHLLCFDLWCHCKVNGGFQRAEAKISCSSKCLSSILSDNTNAIGGSLSQTGTLTSCKLANCCHNLLEIFSAEVSWSKMLNHIVKNENCKLKALLVSTGECSWEHFSP
jgi:hypothetical protein